MEVCAPLGQSLDATGYFRKTQDLERRLAFQKAVALLSWEADRQAREIVNAFLEGRLHGQRLADAAHRAEALLIYAHPFLGADLHRALREQYPMLQQVRTRYELDRQRGLEPIAINLAEFIENSHFPATPTPSLPQPEQPPPAAEPGGFLRGAALEVPADASVRTYRFLNDRELEASRHDLHRLTSSTRNKALEWGRHFAPILKRLLGATFALEARAVRADGQLSVAFVLQPAGSHLHLDGLRRIDELMSLLLHLRQQPEESRRATFAQLTELWGVEDIEGTFEIVDALARQSDVAMGFDYAQHELWLRYDLPQAPAH